MVKTKKQTTLADKISGILNAAPKVFDPEDDVDDTTAKLNEDDSFEEQDNDDDEELILSKFRKQNVDLLADVDERYAGKKGSRKSLQHSSEESDVEENEEEEESDADSEVEKEQVDSEESGSDEEESLDNEEASDDDDEEEADGIDLDESKNDNFVHITNQDASAQVKKGMCVRNQMNIWENLLEMRIQLQKCLITSNKMPQRETFMEIKKQSGQTFTDKVSETKTTLCNALDKLLLLQKIVLKKYPETKNLDKTQSAPVNQEDEEIPSDTEDEMDKSASELSDDEEEKNQRPKKRRKLNEYEQTIKENFDKYKPYRNSVIQKWNEKTRLAVAKNNANSHSVLNQIEHNLADKAKLVKRTQTRRSEYKILGQKEDEHQDEDSENSKPTQEHNTEIFDDDDFYHQLLRELIEVKSADLTDPVQLGRQWIQLQNLRSKMKKKVDTKATKGRKIRYAVHTKLVNFMAPIDKNLWTEEAKNELFSSLFGKKC